MGDQTRHDDGDLIAAIEDADAHEDVTAYVRFARERGGTPILGSMRNFHENSSIARIGEIGTRIERTLWNEGAAETLTMSNLDDTNREILNRIVSERR